MADTLKDIPEFFESELGEAIVSRTDALGKFEEWAFILIINTRVIRHISRIRAT
jgi:hypothetical protein